jgi:hypothetical protein
MTGIHLDCDVTGSASISDLIPDPIRSYSCPNVQTAENVLWEVVKGRLPAQFVMLDTITGFTQRGLQDLVSESSDGIWKNRKKFKAERDHYGWLGDVANRFTGILREFSGYSIILAHERSTEGLASREDPLSGGDKMTPDLQRKILTNLLTFADAIVRLYPSPVPVQMDGVVYPAGTRLLALTATESHTAGVRVPMSRPIPSMMIVHEGDPYAFARFVQILGYIPHNTVIYGPPKIGKTIFAAGITKL